MVLHVLESLGMVRPGRRADTPNVLLSLMQRLS